MNEIIEKYNNVTFIKDDSFHDRFKLYSCGTSFKDLGKKCFVISEFVDRGCLMKILNIVNI